MATDRTGNLPRIPPREADSHKGTYGHLMIVGGSRGMTGAVALAGQSGLRSGAGLVTLLIPETCWSVIAALDPCYMTIPLPADEAGRIGDAYDAIAVAAERASCVAIGPGLGRSPTLDTLVARLYAELPKPLVVDADGLNALAGRPLPSPAGPRILTPHPGEFRRLCPDAPREREALEQLAIERAAEWQVTLVLKGHGTLITDGSTYAHNATGNPGMATGGTGDVLTGIIGALVGQGLAPFDAAHLGVHLHGLAGDLAAAEVGEAGLIASDLVRYLSAAWRSH